MSFLNFLTTVLSGTSANLVSAAIVTSIDKLFYSKPNLKQNFTSPSSPEEFQSAINELIGELEILGNVPKVFSTLI